MKDQIIEIIVKELNEKFNCHTIILYGSRARGDFNENSDYDVAGFSSDVSSKINYAKEIDEKYFDAFIFPDTKLRENVALESSKYLHLKGGLILHEQNSFGVKLLLCVDELIQRCV